MSELSRAVKYLDKVAAAVDVSEFSQDARRAATTHARELKKLLTYIILPTTTRQVNPSIKIVPRLLFQFNVDVGVPFIIIMPAITTANNLKYGILTIKYVVEPGKAFRRKIARSFGLPDPTRYLHWPLHVNETIPSKCSFEFWNVGQGSIGKTNVGIINPFKIQVSLLQNPPDKESLEYILPTPQATQLEQLGVLLDGPKKDEYQPVVQPLIAYH